MTLMGGRLCSHLRAKWHESRARASCVGHEATGAAHLGGSIPAVEAINIVIALVNAPHLPAVFPPFTSRQVKVYEVDSLRYLQSHPGDESFDSLPSLHGLQPW